MPDVVCHGGVMNEAAHSGIFQEGIQHQPRIDAIQLRVVSLVSVVAEALVTTLAQSAGDGGIIGHHPFLPVNQS